MPLFLDTVYAPRLSTKLAHFKKKGNNLWNFRCPVCGDSRTSEYKTRGYLYKQKDDLVFHCHNCNATQSFTNFLKRVDVGLYKEYMFDLMQYKSPAQAQIVKPKKIEKTKYDLELPSIATLPDKHVAKQYCVGRKIPKIFFDELYYAEDFKVFADRICPDNDRKLLNREQRLVIPFLDEFGYLIGFQGRALAQTTNQLRYISIRLDESSEKMVYGLNKLDQTKKIYVVEGPFDSMFLVNAIAVANSQLTGIARILGHNKNYTFIYDNQPRNKDIVGGIESAINMGFPVFIWPKELKEFKDINDAVKAGYTGSEIQTIIDSRTYSEPLMARLEWMEWQK